MGSKYRWDEYMNGETWLLRGRFAGDARKEGAYRVDCSVTMFHSLLLRQVQRKRLHLDVMELDPIENTITFRVTKEPPKST